MHEYLIDFNSGRLEPPFVITSLSVQTSIHEEDWDNSNKWNPYTVLPSASYEKVQGKGVFSIWVVLDVGIVKSREFQDYFSF